MPRKKEKVRNMVKKIARDAKNKIVHVNQHMHAAGHERINTNDDIEDPQDFECENLLHRERKPTEGGEVEADDMRKDYSLGSASDLDRGRNTASRVSGGEEEEGNNTADCSLDKEAIIIDTSLAKRSRFHFNEFGDEEILVEMSSEKGGKDSQVESYDDDDDLDYSATRGHDDKMSRSNNKKGTHKFVKVSLNHGVTLTILIALIFFRGRGMDTIIRSFRLTTRMTGMTTMTLDLSR